MSLIIILLYINKIDLLYTDTDSLMYQIKTENFYEDMKQMIDHFDTSDHPENNIYGLARVNKKVLGKMKDVMNEEIMTEFIGLRSMMYATVVQGDEEREKKLAVKKSKGVKKNLVEKDISFDDYKECLFKKGKKIRHMNLIRSYHHYLITVEVNIKALSPFDNKRYVLEDGIATLP